MIVLIGETPEEKALAQFINFHHYTHHHTHHHFWQDAKMEQEYGPDGMYIAMLQ